MVGLVTIQARWISVASKAKQSQLRQQMSSILTEVVHESGHTETVTLSGTPLGATRGYNKSSYTSQGTFTTSGGRLLEKTTDIITIPTIDTTNFMNNLRSAVGDSTKYRLFTDKVLSSQGKYKKDEFGLSSLTQRIYVESITEKVIGLDLPLEQRTSLKELDSLITKEFEQRGFSASHKLAITNSEGSYLLRDEGFDENKGGSIYQQKLFPYDPESAPKYYLQVYIPKQGIVIIRSMGIMFLASIVLILIIVVLFIATLSIIFRQKRLAEIRSDFVSNMTHELKTPIATISLAAQMLEDKNIPVSLKNVDHLSKMVREESRRLGMLVEKVLQMAIFDRGTFKLKRKSLDVHSIIRKTIENYSLQFQAKHVKVTCEFNASESTIFGDEVHITNIISNLIDNAIKYSTDSPTIGITTLNKNDGIVVSVKDNGIGVSKEYQKRIFDQFFRVPTGNVHSVKGFGLGLSYVKKIAEMHDGQIWLQSEQGQGSTFSIYLPLLKENIDNNTKN